MDKDSCIYTLYDISIGAHLDPCDSVELNVRLFLEAAMNESAQFDTIMRNYLQAHPRKAAFPNIKLPVQNPYKDYAGYGDVEGVYYQINDTLGPAGKVTDWILVEIWGNVDTNAFRYTLLERRALLLTPKGYVVDTLGNVPKFSIYSGGNVRIVVKHRNHLAVMSRVVPFTLSAYTYDFTLSQNQAYNYYNAYGPMVKNKSSYPQIHNSVWCLWAADFDMDAFDNAQDLNIFTIHFADNLYTYQLTDVNLDGIVNVLDQNFVRDNTLRSIYSPVLFFTRNP